MYLNLSEEEAERRMKKRWAIMYVWQPILNPVKRDPLAFCDYQSLDENDFRIVVANLPPPGAGGEYGNVSKNLKHTQRAEYSSNGEQAARYEVTNMAYNPNQRWYYASDMTPEEAWVFKIYDTKESVAKCAVHSSFPLAGQTEAEPARQSIELRCFVFWDDE